MLLPQYQAKTSRPELLVIQENYTDDSPDQAREIVRQDAEHLQLLESFSSLMIQDGNCGQPEQHVDGPVRTTQCPGVPLGGGNIK